MAWAALAIGSFVVLVTALVPTPDGPLALAAILVAHLSIALVLIGLLGWAIDRGRWSATPVLVLLLVLGARFGAEWLSLPAAQGDGRLLTVMSWNLEFGSRSPESVSDVIVEHDADVVALQELTPATATALEDDPRRDRVRRECRNEPGEEGDEHGWSRAHGGQNLSATDVE